MKIKDSKLSKCPFCENRAAWLEWNTYQFIGCIDCGFQTPWHDPDDMAEAELQWAKLCKLVKENKFFFKI